MYVILYAPYVTYGTITIRVKFNTIYTTNTSLQ